jgi:membrane-associated protein
LLSAAAIAGDTVNYWAGHYIGPKAFSGNIRFLKKEHLERTHRFYEKYGGKTIVLARFIPIIRTFAPFVAGIGSMTYWRFIAYNIVGGALWVMLFVMAGWRFGQIEAVKKNFTLVIMAIIFLSILPAVIEFLRARRHPEEQPAAETQREE